jgi:multicomponent Na+:H+ antiporter subunit B
MKISSFIALVFILGFLFISMFLIHPVGEPLGNVDLLKNVTDVKSIDKSVTTMDDYYTRNGQLEAGTNNIVTSIVFDYRGFDTLGEGTVLFIAVSGVSMLLYQLLKKRKEISEKKGFSKNSSRIIGYAAMFLFPLITIFGAYLVIHGHLTPGGGFQGGAVMASGMALLLIAALVTRNSKPTRKALAIFESVALTIFIGMGFLGIGVSFLYNFLANSNNFFGKTIELGSNPGFIGSAGILPIVSLAVGIEVFCGLSIILVSLYNVTKENKESEE